MGLYINCLVNMRLSICILLLISSAAWAEEKLLLGEWDGGDTVSMSIYGTIKISTKTISWNKNNNYNHNCKLTYKIQNEQFGVAFEDQVGNKYVTAENSKFTTYLLKIIKDNCATDLGYIRFTFPFENQFSYLAMIKYDKSGNANGWVHFDKKQN